MQKNVGLHSECKSAAKTFLLQLLIEGYIAE